MGIREAPCSSRKGFSHVSGRAMSAESKGQSLDQQGEMEENG